MKKIVCLLFTLLPTHSVFAISCHITLVNHAATPLIAAFQRYTGNVWVYDDTHPNGIENPVPISIASEQKVLIKATTSANLTSGIITVEEQFHPQLYCKVHYQYDLFKASYLYLKPNECNINYSTIMPVTPPCSGVFSIGSADQTN